MWCRKDSTLPHVLGPGRLLQKWRQHDRDSARSGASPNDVARQQFLVVPVDHGDVDMRGATVGRRHRTDEAERPLAIRLDAPSPAGPVSVRSSLPEVHERSTDGSTVARADYAPLENVARSDLRAQRCVEASEGPGAIVRRRLARSLRPGLGQRRTGRQHEKQEAREKPSHARQDTALTAARVSPTPRRVLTFAPATRYGGYVSSMIVTGPSFTSDTCMRAPKTPRATPAPASSSAPQKRS